MHYAAQWYEESFKTFSFAVVLMKLCKHYYCFRSQLQLEAVGYTQTVAVPTPQIFSCPQISSCPWEETDFCLVYGVTFQSLQFNPQRGNCRNPQHSAHPRLGSGVWGTKWALSMNLGSLETEGEPSLLKGLSLSWCVVPSDSWGFYSERWKCANCSKI